MTTVYSEPAIFRNEGESTAAWNKRRNARNARIFRKNNPEIMYENLIN